MRSVVIHYHLFKNAGTSVDKLLQENFGQRWCTFEGKNNKLFGPTTLAKYILRHPLLQAISSHTALLPLPSHEQIDPFPIIFVRHPIDRIRSVYEFERSQQIDTPATIKAREVTFREFVQWRLALRHDVSFRNFQVSRLAEGTPTTRTADSYLRLRERAIETLNRLPFVGLVNEFSASIRQFERLLRPNFPGIRLHPVIENARSSADSTMETRLDEVRQTLGRELYEQLLSANSLDMELYELVEKRVRALADARLPVQHEG
jgi:hypothetical protein